jgi:energy-coupling factor transport system permease protein
VTISETTGTGAFAEVAPQPSLLARRNPTVKFVAVSIVSLTLLAVFDPITPAIVYVLMLVGVATTSGVTLGRIVVGHLPFAAFGFSLLMVNAITRGGDVVVVLGPIDITDEGLAVGASLAIRTLVIGVAVIGFVATTDPTRLLTSLRQQAHLPPRVAYALLAAYRLLDDLPARWNTILRAHAVRMPNRVPGRLPRSPRFLARAAFTLLVISLRQAERLATTLELRGLGTGPRSTWKPTPVDRGDWTLLGVVIGAMVAVLVVSAARGWLQGIEVLFRGM